MKKRFIALIISMVMLIPNIVLGVVNFIFYRGENWSVFIAASTLLAWCVFILPFFLKKVRPYLFWAVDTAALSGYMYVYVLTKITEKDVYFSVLSFIGLLSLSSLVFIAWYRHKKSHWTAVMSFVFGEIAAVFLLCGIIVKHIINDKSFFYVGLIVSLCALSLTFFFVYCAKSKRMRAWLSKAFYI